MIRKSGSRFSEEIMLREKERVAYRAKLTINPTASSSAIEETGE
jgi:hypothetical protein